MTNRHTKPYDPSMTESPVTDAYLERAARRDDPNDKSVCEHNIDLHVERCPQHSIFAPDTLKRAREKNSG